MTRMRKERPTMRIDVSLETAQEFVDWTKKIVKQNPDGTYPLFERPMPPIRCTMPVPCGVCWYCKQHEVRQ